MIQLPPFKHIFPINRTRVFPSWGNSYVDNWMRFETFIGGVDAAVMCMATPNMNNRVYRLDALIDSMNNFNQQLSVCCVMTLAHPDRTP